MSLPSYNKYIELYITPALNPTNIPKMDALYARKPALDFCMISKYKPYLPNGAIIQTLPFKPFGVNDDDELAPKTNIIFKYSDFGVQCLYGYNEKNKPTLNLVILVKEPAASMCLVKKTVTFQHDDGKTTTREIWGQGKYAPLDVLVLNIVGEYNFMNHIGYIEIMHADDLKTTNDKLDADKMAAELFTELSDIRSALDVIIKQHNYKTCGYCSHSEIQVNLNRCTQCKNVYYCSKMCQKSAWKTHKLICVDKL
jgi:hypothetical protein